MKLPTPANDNIADDEPLPLAEACKLFPYARLTPSTLRSESTRGRLVIFRLGKRDYTTLDVSDQWGRAALRRVLLSEVCVEVLFSIATL